MKYEERAERAAHPVAQRLLALMAKKESNLILSADVTRASELFSLIEHVGPFVCAVKTHVDILDDFSETFSSQLKALAKQHQFLVFEDRKFADIGNTVYHQLHHGVYRISSWADIVNAHILPGEGIIEGLMHKTDLVQTGLLLLAQMSSKGNYLTPEYAAETVRLAKKYPQFVMGFICQEKLVDDPGMIHMTPGVHLSSQGDALSQRYAHPSHVIGTLGVDAMIVGRGIYGHEAPDQTAAHYREAGWSAYLEREGI